MRKLINRIKSAMAPIVAEHAAVFSPSPWFGTVGDRRVEILCFTDFLHLRVRDLITDEINTLPVYSVHNASMFR